VHRLQLTGVFFRHTIPPAGLDGGVLTYNHRERRTGIITQEEPLFPPSKRQVGD
jgi:hypothetical protein